MMDLIFGCVLDRFRRLRVGFFESDLGWLPYWLDRLDEHFEVMGHHTPQLVRRPSEIFREQCFVSMEANELPGLRWMLEKDLLRCILWGSDYPHFDCTYPGAYVTARKTFEAADATASARIVCDNPRRYSLRLAPAGSADRRGPRTVSSRALPRASPRGWRAHPSAQATSSRRAAVPLS